MISVFYIIKTLLTAFMYVFILRLWMHYIRASYYNPFTQFIVNVTQPILNPLKKIIPNFKQIDLSAAFVIYLVGLIKVTFILRYGFGAPIWQMKYVLFAFYSVLSAAGHLIFWLLLARAILSWITHGHSAADDVLSQLTEPLVQPIRRIIPPLGHLDLSFMVFVFVLMALNLVAYDVFGYVWGIM